MLIQVCSLLHGHKCFVTNGRTSHFFRLTQSTKLSRVNTPLTSKFRGSTPRTGQTPRGWKSVLVRQRRANCASFGALVWVYTRMHACARARARGACVRVCLCVWQSCVIGCVAVMLHFVCVVVTPFLSGSLSHFICQCRSHTSFVSVIVTLCLSVTVTFHLSVSQSCFLCLCHSHTLSVCTIITLQLSVSQSRLVCRAPNFLSIKGVPSPLPRVFRQYFSPPVH